MTTHAQKLAMLVESYRTGQVSEPLMIDNDQTTVYHETGRPAPDDYQKVFDMDPHDLLEAALDLLGIPHEHV